MTDDDGRGIYDSPILEQGIDIETILDLLKFNVDRPGINPASGGHLGYVPGGGVFHSALGDYLADVTNRYAGIFFASPGAVRMENMLLDWMADMVGYPDTMGGNLTSGGSLANLMGVVTARDAHDIQAEEVKRAVVYVTEHMHHSVDKALRIAGLKACLKRTIRVDKNYRMDAPALVEAIANDKKSGLRPWLVVASAGTTNTGSVDPMPAIGDIAHTHQLWLHIDGAYGAFFALCEAGKKILSGMEKSDSITMDPHKTLFLPYGSGAVLVKDRQKMYEAHYYQADYMQDALEAGEEFSPADLSPELTRHFRGLRLWLPLKLLGVAPFRAVLEEKMLLTRYFYHKIQEIDGFEVGPYPELSIATYRYVPKRGDVDAFNKQLIKEVQKDGRIFISSTLLDGKFILRLAVVSFRTHLDTIDLALDILAQKAKYLAENM
jgi:glutamate/tyrosine decarboxylase-like PLP-dependent enzyme